MNTMILAHMEKRDSKTPGQCLRSRFLSLYPPDDNLPNPAPAWVALAVEGEVNTPKGGSLVLVFVLRTHPPRSHMEMLEPQVPLVQASIGANKSS